MRRPNNPKKRKTSHDHGPSAQNGSADDLHTAKPSAVFTPTGGRSHTLSVAIPGSIVGNAHSSEQKTLLAGLIARALAVFCVDEVVVFDDDEKSPRMRHNDPQTDGYYDPIAKTHDQLNGDAASTKGYTAYSDPSHFLAHLLSYLETPPYLRKHLFPMHPNLRSAGLLPSLDMPHHLRANEWCDYREGIVVSSAESNGNGNGYSYGKQNGSSNGRRNSTTVIDTGLPQKIVVPDVEIPEHARVTVRFSQDGHEQHAEPVHPSTPRSEAGYYWGYYVRRCPSLSSVFTECPFDGGYDLSFGTSERGAPVSAVLQDEDEDSSAHNGNGNGNGNGSSNSHHDDHHPEFKHLLIVFGGVAGLENAIRNDPQLRDMEIGPSEAAKLFDYYVNLLPGQGSRTIRTEEAVWLGLSSLRGLVDGTQRPKSSYRNA